MRPGGGAGTFGHPDRGLSLLITRLVRVAASPPPQECRRWSAGPPRVLHSCVPAGLRMGSEASQSPEAPVPALARASPRPRADILNYNYRMGLPPSRPRGSEALRLPLAASWRRASRPSWRRTPRTPRTLGTPAPGAPRGPRRLAVTPRRTLPGGRSRRRSPLGREEALALLGAADKRRGESAAPSPS